jgi:hypothetical protein
MKSYIITLLVKSGQIRVHYTDNPQSDSFETLQEFETRMQREHGDFIMLSCVEL